MGRAKKLKEARRRARAYPQLPERAYKQSEAGQTLATGRRALYKHLKRKLKSK